MRELDKMNYEGYAHQTYPLQSMIKLEVCIEFSEHLLVVATLNEVCDCLYALSIGEEIFYFTRDKRACYIEYQPTRVPPGENAVVVMITKPASIKTTDQHIIRVMCESGSIQQISINLIPYLKVQLLALQAIWTTHGKLIQGAIGQILGQQHPFLLAANELGFAKDHTTADAEQNVIHFEGHLDIVFDHKVSGWIWNSRYQDSKYAVEILSDGQIVAEGMANLFRSDLLENGVGDGYFGFSITLPISVRDGFAHTISARIKHTQVNLTGSIIYKNNELQNQICDFMPLDFIREMICENSLQLTEKSSDWEFSASTAIFANQLMMRGQLKEAEVILSRLFNQHNDHPLVMCLLGQCCLLQEKITAAQELYSKAAQTDSYQFWASLGLANCCAKLGQWQDTMTILSQIQFSNSDKPLVLRRKQHALMMLKVEQARLNFTNMEIESGIELLKPLFLANPDNTELHQVLLQGLTKKTSVIAETRLTLNENHARLYDEIVLFDFLLDAVVSSRTQDKNEKPN